MLAQLRHTLSDFCSEPMNRRFLHLIFLAILLRVLIMPFFAHMDALSEARRVFYWAENNIFLGNTARNTTMFIEVIFYHITSLFLSNAHGLYHINDITQSTSTIPHYFEFVSNPHIFRALFFIKLPYLVFDIGTAFIIYNYFSDKTKAIRSCLIWCFNPITLFAFYIFARFESIPIFFIAAALLACKKQRIILAAFLLGLCLNGREMMIMYSPIFILTVLFASFKHISMNRKIVSICIVLLFTIIALQLYTYILPDSVGAKVGTIMKEGRVKHLFNFNLHGIMFIPLIYALILMWIASSNIIHHQKLLLGCGLAMLSFFAFSSHSAHYPAWLMLFPAIYFGYDRRILWPFIALCLAWFIHWLSITDLGVFTLWLASPFSLNFIGVPNVPMLYQEFAAELGIFDRDMIIYLARSVFLASLFYMAGLMLQITLKKVHHETP